MIPRITLYLSIAVDNLIPLVGFFLFDWDLTLIFLFYAVELTAYELFMIPRIIIFTNTSGEYMLDSSIKKIGLSISWLLYHLMLYVFTMMFLLHTAFVVSPAAGAPVTMTELYSFLDEYNIAIFFVTGSYFIEFIVGYLGLKEYEVLPSGIQLKEIAIFYVILLVMLALINGASVLFSVESEPYQIVILIAIISIKTISQVLLRKSKSKFI